MSLGDLGPWILPVAGLVLLLSRMLPLVHPQAHTLMYPRAHSRLQRRPPNKLASLSDQAPAFKPIVTVIIPARNEDVNIAACVESLMAQNHANLEIIVVDDQSTDQTAEIAAGLGAKVISSTNRPPGWSGKNWACFQGAKVAQGEYLLFTDADTIHAPSGLSHALSFAVQNEYDLVSALPFHTARHAWEKGLGLFHLMLLTLTAPFHEPSTQRLYAIGQFLLFKKSAYFALGGHERVSSVLSEDVKLAQVTIEAGMRYAVYTRNHLYSVQMYDSLQSFIQGWRRNFRLGIGQFGVSAALEVVALFSLFAAFLTPRWPLALLGAAFLLLAQARLGRFKWTSLPLIPFSMGLFTWISCLAVYDRVLGRDLVWKGRSYTNGGS